jgi:diguanylate cyclase (GGDEF)-like protein
MAAAVVTEVNGEAVKPRFVAKAAEWFNIDAETAQIILAEVAKEAKELSRLFRINISDDEAPSIYSMLAQAEEMSLQTRLSEQRETESLRKKNSHLARMAVTDALTGVGNRKQFDAAIESHFATAHRTGSCLGMLMVDADRFKTVNDTYGHPAGDAVLIELAKRMTECVGDSGVVCRYGGEEFAVIMPGADRRAAARVAESIRIAISTTPFDVAEGEGSFKQLPVTVSIGVCALEPQVAHQIVNHQVLTRAADRALYAAKESGRNCVRVFTVQPVASKATAGSKSVHQESAGALKTPAPNGR